MPLASATKHLVVTMSNFLSMEGDPIAVIETFHG